MATKKVGSAGRFGSRYGRKIRAKIKTIEIKQKGWKKCPKCAKFKVKRVAKGLFQLIHARFFHAICSAKPQKSTQRLLIPIITGSDTMNEPVKIVDDIFAIGGPDITDPADCCIYLISGKSELLLIDSGLGESVDNLLFNIEELGFDHQKITFIIATHAHIDHIGGLFRLREACNAKILAHAMDAHAIETGEKVGKEFYGVAYAPCNVDISIKSPLEKLDLFPYELNILHIPGHTPGSIAVYLDKEGK